jgi:hypothetical protein
MKPMTCDEFFDLIPVDAENKSFDHRPTRQVMVRFLVKAGLAQIVSSAPGKRKDKPLHFYTFHPAVLMGLGLEYPEDTP